MPFRPKKMSGFDRERLHNTISGVNFKIALMIEQPIPDEPPVTMITENRSKYVECFMCVSGIGFFVLTRIKASESFGSVKSNQ